MYFYTSKYNYRMDVKKKKNTKNYFPLYILCVLYDSIRLSTISTVVNQMHQPLCQATPVNSQGTGLHFRHQKETC